jgi:exopolysaccharide biosynthesis polyprenyl glycosylphosphotransferase
MTSTTKRTRVVSADFEHGVSTAALDRLYNSLDERTVELLHSRRSTGSNHGRGWLLRRALLAADMLGLASAYALAEWLATVHRHGDHVDAFGEFLLFAASLPIWAVAARSYGLYDRDEEHANHSAADDFVGVFHLVTVGTFGLLAVAHLTDWFQPPFSKLFLFWLIAILAVTSARAVGRAFCRRRSGFVQNTIVVGTGRVGQEVARKVVKHPEYGINVIGFVDDDPQGPLPGLGPGDVRLLGEIDHLPALVKLLDVERVIIAFTHDPIEHSLDMIRTINELGVQVDIVPRFFELLEPPITAHTIESIPLWALPPLRLAPSSRFAKRALDVVGATLGLLFLSPLLIVIAAAIKIDSRGPVFFRQTRIGEHGRQFRIWKFRSMIDDADSRKSEVAHLNKHLENGGGARMFKIDGDPRCTRVGELLRRTSLDELPQLLNVVLGQMSLVGPRPLIPEEHRFVERWAKRRLDLRPGITGLWQVLGRHEIGFDEMIQLDYRYVMRWSLWRDIMLLFQTVPVVLHRRAGI